MDALLHRQRPAVLGRTLPGADDARSGSAALSLIEIRPQPFATTAKVAFDGIAIWIDGIGRIIAAAEIVPATFRTIDLDLPAVCPAQCPEKAKLFTLILVLTASERCPCCYCLAVLLVDVLATRRLLDRARVAGLRNHRLADRAQPVFPRVAGFAHRVAHPWRKLRRSLYAFAARAPVISFKTADAYQPHGRGKAEHSFIGLLRATQRVLGPWLGTLCPALFLF